MIDFYVRGAAAPQGSKRAFVVKGRPVLTESSRAVGPWRQAVNAVAQIHAPETPLEGAVTLRLDFYLPRPASLPRRVVRHSKRPDSDKLARSCADALTGVLYRDDAQIDVLVVTKSYDAPGHPAGVRIRCWPSDQIDLFREHEAALAAEGDA